MTNNLPKTSLFALTALLSALFALTSCGGKDNPTVTPALSVSPTSLNPTSEASTFSVTVTSNVAWTASSSESWVSLSPASGNGDATVSLSVSANEGARRTATVTFSASGLSDRQVSVVQAKAEAEEVAVIGSEWDGVKRAGTTYQLLIYSFCDSDGDGIGDFGGITSRMDYFDSLGVSGLWLSPMHPADSYHGYDVTDYYTVNPDYGTEEDFRTLLSTAHSHGIEVYIDYVLNHTGKGHPWFTDALASEDSEYRDYYLISTNPEADAADPAVFPMLDGYTYKDDEWIAVTPKDGTVTGRYRFDLDISGTPTVTVTESADSLTEGTSAWNVYWWTDSGSDAVRFVQDGDSGTQFHAVADLADCLGFLIRRQMDWSDGSKYGGYTGKSLVKMGEAIQLYRSSSAEDLTFSAPSYYMAAFGSWMPDLNYGAASTASESGAFKDIAASVDKWIGMGVDGLRLDAVKHIYGGISTYDNAANVTFLTQWYDHCNAAYKAAGGTKDIFMVGEVFNEWNSEAPYSTYLEALPSVFNFSFWWRLCDALNGSTSHTGASVTANFIDYMKVFSGSSKFGSYGVSSNKLSNHDEDRAGSTLGKSAAKEKQAAAVLLTAEGKPFIYQGEELGYYGTKDGGDEYVRTPMNWDGGAWADGALGGKVLTALKGSAYSVSSQEADANSVLNVYESFSRIRNTYPALATGSMSAHGTYDSSNAKKSIACWYMTSGSERMLVVHNISSSSSTLTFKDDCSRPVVTLGTVSVSGIPGEYSVSLGAYSSVVFKLY